MSRGVRGGRFGQDVDFCGAATGLEGHFRASLALQDLGSVASSTGTLARHVLRHHLYGLTASITMHISNQSRSMTVNIFLFSLLDLKTASGAPEQEVTLHTIRKKCQTS